MMDTSFYTAIEAQALCLLQKRGATVQADPRSPRAVGDAVQGFLSQHLAACIPSDRLAAFEDDFSRRAMEDMAFTDREGNYFAIDVKTHNLETDFNMPNLISAKRLAQFYRNDRNYYCILMVEYAVRDGRIEYQNCRFRPIEALDWRCLTLGALGWGQIQLVNANRITYTPTLSRRDWMLALCNRMHAFYEAEIGKITRRSLWFTEIQGYWESK